MIDNPVSHSSICVAPLIHPIECEWVWRWIWLAVDLNKAYLMCSVAYTCEPLVSITDG